MKNRKASYENAKHYAVAEKLLYMCLPRTLVVMRTVVVVQVDYGGLLHLVRRRLFPPPLNAMCLPRQLVRVHSGVQKRALA